MLLANVGVAVDPRDRIRSANMDVVLGYPSMNENRSDAGVALPAPDLPAAVTQARAEAQPVVDVTQIESG